MIFLNMFPFHVWGISDYSSDVKFCSRLTHGTKDLSLFQFCPYFVYAEL